MLRAQKMKSLVTCARIGGAAASNDCTCTASCLQDARCIYNPRTTTQSGPPPRAHGNPNAAAALRAGCLASAVRHCLL